MPELTHRRPRLKTRFLTATVFCSLVNIQSIAMSQPLTARVLSVGQETFATTTRKEICWQTILTAHQKAVREEQNTPWLIRNWQPLLGAAMGGAIGFQFTGNYGTTSQKWVWPTVIGGAAVGAIAGPGATAGAYGLGTLAYSLWPASLPLTAGFTLAGGIIGKILWDMIFPPNKDLQAPQPGEFMTNQVFYLETTCTKPERVEYRQAPYLVTYAHDGKTLTARVKYYPGARIELNSAGRPVHEIMDSQ